MNNDVSKKLTLLGITLLLSVSLPLLTLSVQKSQETRSRADVSTNPDLGQQTVKVLVLKYFPLDATGTTIDTNETGPLFPSTLPDIQTKVDGLTQQAAQKLTEATRYHGYKDSAALPSLTYTITDTKEFLKPIPKSNHHAWNNPTFRPDYVKILTEDVNVCDYIDNQGVNQVWIWGYHNGAPGGIEPDESNMSMGRVSRNFWNHVTYGDVSNSAQIDDLPLCNNTYVAYNYSYSRGLGEMFEDHGHQIESELNFVQQFIWYKLRNPHGNTDSVVINHCGWIHSPPNVTDPQGQYDWFNETTVKSDCQDWKPGGGGGVQDVNCHTWMGNSCAQDGGVKYKVWWMQSLPGLSNNLLYQGKIMRNWWDFYGNFDQALAKGKWLVDLSAVTYTITGTVFIDYNENGIKDCGNGFTCDTFYSDTKKPILIHINGGQSQDPNYINQTTPVDNTGHYSFANISANYPNSIGFSIDFFAGGNVYKLTNGRSTLFTFSVSEIENKNFNFGIIPVNNPIPTTATPTPQPPTITQSTTITPSIIPSPSPMTIRNNIVIPSSIPNSATPTQLPQKGDANNDNRVDLLDFNIWRDEFLNSQGSIKHTDFNQDGKVDLLDFNIWRHAYLTH